MTANDPDWTLSIYVPDDEAEVVLAPDPAAEDHSIRDFVAGGKRIERVRGKDLQAQWSATVDHLLKLGANAASQAQGWTVSEIEVGLTLSAKGELLFIAEAGAEASVKLKLTRI
jgi:hypothetical protein